MDKNTFKVLVPHDFSTVADCAVNHASKIAHSFAGEVYLLHVVSKQKEIDDAKERLTKIAETAESKNGTPFHVIVRIGNIFEDIGDVASEISAGFIVMGTHGAKGMQKIMGSYALRVISHSKVPFVIVQNKDPKKTETYDDIVVPVDSSEVTKQKLAVAANIASKFGSKIHLFYDLESDEFLQKKLERELSFARNYFLERSITYTLNQAEESGSFKKQLIKFASRIDADLIAVVNTQVGALLPDFFGSEEQEVIANDAEIPVIITNPTQQVVSGGVIGT
ncbi:MAG: universal stress protein [Bacteroidetes bacterium]|nr:universal stress protein [Bacteroidota bacterium]